MRSQVDGLGLTGAGILERRRRLLAHVEEDEGEVPDKHDDARDAVREECVLRSYTPHTDVHCSDMHCQVFELH